jgi:hypothetical protein
MMRSGKYVAAKAHPPTDDSATTTIKPYNLIYQSQQVDDNHNSDFAEAGG